MAVNSVSRETATAYSQAQAQAGGEFWIDVYRYEKRRPSPAPSVTQSKEQELAAIRSSLGVLPHDLTSSASAAAEEDDESIALVSADLCHFNTAQYVTFMQQQKAARSAHRDGCAAVHQFMLVRLVCAPHAPTVSLALRGMYDRQLQCCMCQRYLILVLCLQVRSSFQRMHFGL